MSENWDELRQDWLDFCDLFIKFYYSERAEARFAPLLRQVRVVSLIEMEDELEACLSEEEFRDLLLVDLVISRYPRSLKDAPQIWLAVEVTWEIDRHDVERAQRRAGCLNKAGYAAVPAVAGEDVTEGAKRMAENASVLVVLDGHTALWDQALEQVVDKV